MSCWNPQACIRGSNPNPRVYCVLGLLKDIGLRSTYLYKDMVAYRYLPLTGDVSNFFRGKYYHNLGCDAQPQASILVDAILPPRLMIEGQMLYLGEIRSMVSNARYQQSDIMQIN
jgi:hypothetical protein